MDFHRLEEEISGTFSGSILASMGSEVVFKKSFGLANVEFQVGNTPSTKYRIWSITKLFTAVAIMMLVERGRLTPEQTIDRYFPDEPVLNQRITIRHLLTHTSGIHSYTSSADFDTTWNKQPLGMEGVLRLIRQYPPCFAPGADTAYNNSAYFLLGSIIEKVTGESYAAYLKRMIFDPLGMSHTGLEDNYTIIPGMANGYSQGEAGLRKCEYTDIETAFSAGGLYSTVEDLHQWDQALHADRLISRDTRAEMMTEQSSGYGLGFRIGEMLGRRMVGHSGSYRGFRGRYDRFPDEQASIIVLSNVDVPIEGISEAVATTLFECN